MIYPDTEAVVLSAMARAFDSAGFDGVFYQTVYNKDLRYCRVCPAPPLSSKNFLDTLPLENLVGPRTEVPFEKFCEVYNAFCRKSFYRRHTFNKIRDLERGLKIPGSLANFYFNLRDTDSLESWHKLNYERLLALAQCARVSYDGECTIHSANSFVIKANDVRFGIYAGRPLVGGRIDKRADYSPMIHKQGLASSWSRKFYNLKPNLIDAAYGQLLITELPEDLKVGILEGLRILRLADSDLGFRQLVVERLPFEKVGFKELQARLKDARNFEYFEDASLQLKDILVPRVIPGRRFNQLFSNREVGTGLAMRYRVWKRWHARLDQLEKEVLGAVENSKSD